MFYGAQDGVFLALSQNGSEGGIFDLFFITGGLFTEAVYCRRETLCTDCVLPELFVLLLQGHDLGSVTNMDIVFQ